LFTFFIAFSIGLSSLATYHNYNTGSQFPLQKALAQPAVVIDSNTNIMTTSPQFNNTNVEETILCQGVISSSQGMPKLFASLLIVKSGFLCGNCKPSKSKDSNSYSDASSPHYLTIFCILLYYHKINGKANILYLFQKYSVLTPQSL
jgi:hypothetical protein